MVPKKHRQTLDNFIKGSIVCFLMQKQIIQTQFFCLVVFYFLIIFDLVFSSSDGITFTGKAIFGEPGCCGIIVCQIKS